MATNEHPVTRARRLWRNRKARLGRLAAKQGLRLRTSRGTTPVDYLQDAAGRIVFPPAWVGLDQYPLDCGGSLGPESLDRFVRGLGAK